MNRYQSGYYLEWEVANIFRNNGFDSTRSPASKGPIDVYALSEKKNYLVQCKRTTTQERLYVKDEPVEMMKMANKIGAVPLVCYKFYYTPIYVEEVTTPSLKLCKSGDNVELIDYLKE